MAHDASNNNPLKETLTAAAGIGLLLVIIAGIAISAWLRPAGEHQPAEPVAEEAAQVAPADAPVAEATEETKEDQAKQAAADEQAAAEQPAEAAAETQAQTEQAQTPAKSDEQK